MTKSEGPDPDRQDERKQAEETTIRERVNEIDGTILVQVPGGDFILGSDELTDLEKPAHRVRISSFWIGKFSITNEQYALFLQANPGCRRPAFWGEENFNRPRQPVVGVSWEDARNYAKWAGLCLPSEAQWEAAARGPAGRRFPWGDDPPTPDHANYRTGTGKTTPVDAHPLGQGPYGTFGQAGNVWEWCEDALDPEAYQKRIDGERDPRVSFPEPAFRVLHGGSWLDSPGCLEAAMRFRYWARLRRRFLGFRCALRAED